MYYYIIYKRVITGGHINMTKTTRVISVIVAVVISFSLLVSMNTAFAITPSQDMFAYQPFEALVDSSHGQFIQAQNMVFVDDNWAGVANDEYVYLKYGDEVYKARKGENAFSTIPEAVAAAGRTGLTIKVGAGTYGDVLNQGNTFMYQGLKILGNYAGVEPNVDTALVYEKGLNPLRDPAKETVVTAAWTLGAKVYNTTIDGCRFEGSASLVCYQSSAYTGEIYIYNNIFDGISLPVAANGGFTTTLHVKYNRFIGISGYCGNFGGANTDILWINNYFEGCKNSVLYVNATGSLSKTNGGAALVLFKDNVVNGATDALRLEYNNSGYSENYAHNRVEDNIFYGCSGTYTIWNTFYPDCEGGKTPVCLDPNSKTQITNNQFLNIPESTNVIQLTGRDSLTGLDVKFTASVNENNFEFANKKSTANIALSSTMRGVVDFSHNYYNTDSKSTLFNVNKRYTTAVVAPYYANPQRTELEGLGKVEWITRTMSTDFDKTEGSYGVDGFNIYSKAFAGKDAVSYDQKSLFVENATYQLYYDFEATKPVKNNKLDVLGERTKAYLVAVDNTSGLATKYTIVLNADIDKSVATFKYLFDVKNSCEYADYRVEGNDVAVNIKTAQLSFPFEVIAYPGGKVSFFTDAECKTAYNDANYYIRPDDKTVVYAKITSADGSATNVYKLTFKRPGADWADAEITSVVSPAENVVLFNSSKNIVYRPFALVESARFDFIVSLGATYQIYSDAALTKLVSKEGDVKELKIGDAINRFYVKVYNPDGYEQVYTLVCYNDVKSTDNTITGVENIDCTINGDIIKIDTDGKLDILNVHFLTNAFATVDVYSSSTKKHALEPSITMKTVNNREVESRTFQLGITGNVSYFYVNVTSEAGQLRTYKLVITKAASKVSFADMSSHWSKAYVEDVANLGIVSGYPEGAGLVFKPENNATRQEMAVLLLRTFGIEPTAFKNVSLGDAFTDGGKIAEWSYDYAKGVYALGIMVGSDKLFNPENNITRQEFFQAVSQVLNLDKNAAADVDLSKFADGASVAGWAVPATKACVKAGIVVGSDGKLNPTAPITRAEIATILSKITVIRNDIRY